MAFEGVNSIKVSCWGYDVGALALNPADNFYAFSYYPAFKKTGIELSPLQLPLNTQGPRTFPNLPEKTYFRLPSFIADSLPDAFGNSLIDAWMEQNHIKGSFFSPLDRLAYVGTRAMGALEYRPAIRKGRRAKSTVIQLGDLVSAARKAVRVDLTHARPEEVDAELAQLIEVGTSAGGARAKAVVGFDPRTHQFVSGQFDVPEGFEHWLIKFDTAQPGSSSAREYGRIEYAYYLMARACDIAMSPSQIYEAGGRCHFMTRRFDRGKNGERHHTQTLCAMRGLDYNAVRAHDYSQMFSTIRDLELPPESYDEAFKRMVFNVACSNNDDHSKNHSFILKQGGVWDLAPAYDMTYAHNPASSAWTKFHIMGVGGAFESITKEDILRVSEHYPIKSDRILIKDIVDVAESWPEFAREAELSTKEIDRIGNSIVKCCELLK